MDSSVISIIVVDDHALHRDGTRQILEAYPDLKVVGDAASGEVALALVNQLRPDVVLLDIRLPGMNGIEVARLIIRDFPEVRVLMVSAFDEDEYIRGSMEVGAAGFLRKTTPGKDLVQAIRSVVGGTSVLQSDLAARLWAYKGKSVESAQSNLTERELEVLKLLAAGLQNRQIAIRLGISPRTVDRHCDKIYAKLGVKSRTEAVVSAILSKLYSPG